MTSLRATHSSEGRSSCPTDEVLGAFVEGRLSRNQLRRVGEHLRACDACCDLVERYASAWQIDGSAIGTASTSVGDDEPALALAPGRSFARFVLLHLAGRGGMAEVYSAYDPVLDRRVALKLLHERDGDDTRARMLHEARTVAALSHPHVVAIYDVGRAHGRDYIAMEFVEGGTLAHWLGAASRTEAEILDAFRQAGLGLAAAHAHGLVHRDFKPANVLVGPGHAGAAMRVRVADFGLALASGATATRAGTRGYVAPEQAGGAPPDPLADQYSFCVAMHEALHGRAPAITESEPIVVPPSRTGRKLRSRRIAAALARGMDPDPSQRFASMHALLAALAPRRGRSLAVLGTGVAALGVLAWGFAAKADPCPSTDALRGELWGAADRERARAAFLATALPYAETAWTRTQRVLDTRMDAWAEAAHAACTTGVTRSCDARTRAQLQQTLDVLAHADATSVTEAGALVDALATDDCREPTTPSTVDALQHTLLVGELAAAKAQRLAGHSTAARSQLEQVVDRARELGDDAIRRESELALAAMLPGFGEEDVAVAMLSDLAYAAVATGDDATALEALTGLVLIQGGQSSDLDAAQRWDRDATALLARLDAPPAAVAKLERARAAMRLKTGEFAAANESFRRVLAHAEATHGPEHRVTASALRDLGLGLFNADELDEARACLLRSLAIRERELGADHPDVAASLDLLFAIERGSGEHTRALELARRALAIYERAQGPDHLDTINARMHVGMALEPTDLAAARDTIATALAALERTLGADHAQTTSARFNLAQMDLRLGRDDDAFAEARAAYEAWRTTHGDDHIMVVAATIAMGGALRSLQRYDEARLWLADAERRSRDDPPARRAAASDALARLEVATGDLARAAELYDVGAAGWAEAYGPDHPEAKASRADAVQARAQLARGH